MINKTFLASTLELELFCKTTKKMGDFLRPLFI